MPIRIHFIDHTEQLFKRAEIYVKSDKGFIILKDGLGNIEAIIPLERINFMEVKKKIESSSHFKHKDTIQFKKEEER